MSARLPAEELRTVGMVWERELIRFVRTRTRILSSFIQPVLFLFVLGYGMSTPGGHHRAASTSRSSCSPASWP